MMVAMLLTPLGGQATVFGEDDRLRPDAMLDAAEEARYSATQAIVCQRGNGPEHVAAGNLAKDFTHGVTIAHLFHQDAKRFVFGAADCVFQVRDRRGRLLDRVPFKRLQTLWEDDWHRAPNDLAMFELTRRPEGVDRFLSLDIAPVSAGQEILVVAFHYDVAPYLSKRKTRGQVFSTLGARDAGMRNIFNTDADCVPMSSGGPVYDRSGRLVALMQGESARGETPRRFDNTREYNAAIRLDLDFLRRYAAFVASKK